MTAQTAEVEERRPWLYAFLILGLISATMLTMRVLNMQFLTPEFEVSLIYLPTALAGIIVAYLTFRSRANP